MEDADDAVLQQPSQNGSDEEGSTENVLTANDTSQVQTNSAEVAEQAEIIALNDIDHELEDDDNEAPLRELQLNETQLEEIDEAVEDIVGLEEDEDVSDDMDVNVLTADEGELDDHGRGTNWEDRATTSIRAQQILYSSPVEALIAKIDNYDYFSQCYKRRYANVSDEDDDVLPDDVVSLLTRVLGDAFHVMDRIKVPMHHDYKPAFFRAIRAAIFILNPDDVSEVRQALGIATHKSWNKWVAYRFKCIAQRVRRRIPEPDMLYERLKPVFDYFGDKLDAKTKKSLFNAVARQKANAILVMVKSGLLSDPPGYSFYVRRCNKDGTPKVDKNGLQLYRSIRGTSTLESMHETLTRSFGHTYSGAWYSDCLLTLVRHQHNWRASIRNDRNFPKLHHYDGTLIDKTNELYDFCFGRPKYPNWVSTNDCLCTTSPFGVVRIDGSDSSDVPVVKNGMFTSTSYIAHRQGSNIAYLPVHGVRENTLFRDCIVDAVALGKSLGSSNTFRDIMNKWNEGARGAENGIYKKQVIHLVRKFKSYRKNRSKEDAINNPEAMALLNAVERIPPTSVDGNVPADEFQNFTAATTAARDDDVLGGETNDAGMIDVRQGVNNAGVQQTVSRKRNRRKRCDTEGCFDRFGETCPKMYSKRCLLLEDQGVRQPRLTRTPHPRKCGSCDITGCPAQNNRTKCWALVGNGPAT